MKTSLMIKRIVVTALLCCMLGSLTLMAAELNNSIESTAEITVAPASVPNLLGHDGVHSGAFLQQRWLKILNQPIISHGDFVIEKNVSIRWHLTSPFELLYVFDGKVLQLWEDGKSKTLDRKDDPLLYGFFAFFFKVFDLSLDELAEWFDIQLLEPKGSSRNISLTPKKEFMKKAFTEAVIVELMGQVQSVTIHESKGDKLQLQFTYDENCQPCQK